MDPVIFEWDPEKDAKSIDDHGVSFTEAASVFRDPLAQTLPDPDHSLDEERAIMFGHSDRPRLLLVVYNERQGRIRIISAREATRRERREYEENA